MASAHDDRPRYDRGPSRRTKSADAFRTISEVSEDVGVPQHVLRFWETKFSQIKPLKRGGGRRYYRPEDIELLNRIRAWLYDDGYTIKGVQKLLREAGSSAAVGAGRSSAAAERAPAGGDGKSLRRPGGAGTHARRGRASGAAPSRSGARRRCGRGSRGGRFCRCAHR